MRLSLWYSDPCRMPDLVGIRADIARYPIETWKSVFRSWEELSWLDDFTLNDILTILAFADDLKPFIIRRIIYVDLTDEQAVKLSLMIDGKLIDTPRIM